jgi:hypothetical protein
MKLRLKDVLAKLLAVVAIGMLPLVVYAQTVTGAFLPNQVPSSTASTLTLNYSGFTSNSVGMVLRLYYDSAKVTPGTIVYSNPPGSSQPANSPTAGTLGGCTGANTYIALNWVDFGATWPTPGSGQLATVQFISASSFASNALVCWVDDTTGGAPVRNITGNATLNAPPPTDIPAMSAVCTPATLTDSAGQVSTCTISSDKALAAPLTVNLNPPAASARYITTCGATISIPAGAAGTSNTCTITAVANTTLGDGNVTATLSVAASSSSPASYSIGGSTQNVAVNNDDFATITVAVSPTPVAENSGTAMVYTFTASAANTLSATSIAFTPPPASSRYNSTCTSPISLPANATTVTCSVTPIDNLVVDGPINATVTLLAGPGVYLVGTPSTATGTITDNEIGLGVVASVGTITEGGNAVFTLSCAGVGSATANYSFSGTYVPMPANGSTLVTCGTPTLVTIPTIDDTIVNGTRTLTLTITSLSAPTTGVLINPALSAATVTILDNEAPTIIPTMSTVGLMLLGLLLAASAGFSVRRRRS